MNTFALEHHCRYGTKIYAERADLHGGLTIKWPERHCITEAQKLLDFGEFCAWHRGNIWETLNGFGGYDSISIKSATHDGDIAGLAGEQGCLTVALPSGVSHELKLGEVILFHFKCDSAASLRRAQILEISDNNQAFLLNDLDHRSAAWRAASQIVIVDVVNTSESLLTVGSVLVYSSEESKGKPREVEIMDVSGCGRILWARRVGPSFGFCGNHTYVLLVDTITILGIKEKQCSKS